jgi:hypothetical protein
MTNTMLAECTDIVKNLVGNDYLYFDAAVEVRTGPHQYPFQAWAVCVSPKEELFVMDSNEQWHKLELTDAAGHLVIGSLYQRLKLMRINYAKAS